MFKRVSLLFVFLLVYMISTAAFAGTFKLPDTGQTTCYQDVEPWAEIPCAGTGQDGAYSINPMSFADNDDGTITDNNTGLMWQKQDDGNMYNWYQASGTYDATYNPGPQSACGSLTLGGHSDWRLPTKKELISIVDYSIPYTGPSIDTTYFPNTKSTGYWSSTASAIYPVGAWCVLFYDGSVYIGYKYNGSYVRCVRSRQFPSQNLVDNGNETVTDNRTGLMWQQGEPEYMTWSSALSYCEGLSLGGYSDWRLPNVKEIESLTDDARYDPAIDINFFPNAYAFSYWSSATNVGFPSCAWRVVFSTGGIEGDGYKDSYFRLRCVRGSLLTVILPNGGDVLPSGGQYGICWQAPDNAVKFYLSYSTDNGTSWNFIKTVTGLSCAHWEEVPVVTANKKKCLVKVVGYDSANVRVGEDVSDKPFTIEVLRVTTPDGGELLKAANTWTIRWVTNKTVRPVAKTVLKYTTDGITWNPIKTLSGNPGTYNWIVPNISSTKCKVKVILKDASGVIVGSDVSEKVFTIQP